MWRRTDADDLCCRQSGLMNPQAPKSAHSVDDRAGLTARDLMTPGVVAISVTARLPQAAEALTAHGIHAVMIINCDGRPAGWLTAHGLLKVSHPERGLAWAGDAIGEPVTTVHPHARREEVVRLLSQSGVSRLAVQERPEWMPEGVITDIDLAASVGEGA